MGRVETSLGMIWNSTMEQKKNAFLLLLSSPTQIGVFFLFLYVYWFHFVFLSFHFYVLLLKIPFIIIGDNAIIKFGGGNIFR